jgi:regulator of protease activity HflC (stomatin/prohibitin superfamily)
MGAFEWISALVEWVGKWLPNYRIINTTEGGIKFKGGKRAVALSAGVHWFWPARSTLEVLPMKRQADDLRSQTFVTTDDRVVVAGGMVIYEVDDMLKFAANTYDGATTVKEIVMTSIHDVCCRMSWEQLKDEQRRSTLDTKLKNAARDMLDDYGVKVIKVMLTDLAPGRVLKLIQSTSTDG